MQEQNVYAEILMIIALLFFCLGLVTKFIGFTQFERLNGILSGEIIFKTELIEIENEEYKLKEIKRIEISNEDYKGKRINYTSGNLGPALSNGTGNFLLIILNIEKSIKVNFEMINSNDIQKIRKELINYHINSKVDFWSLAHILGEESTEEIAELTSEIEKYSTTANSGLAQLGF